MNALKKVVHTHTYDNPVDDAESGVHRVAAPVEPDPLSEARIALYAALVSVANAAARLERGGGR
jgi:hypothetical protein